MASITIFGSLLILLSFIGNINGQTCHGKSQYDLCSSNHGCGCLQLSVSDDVSICGILGVSCSRLQPCQSPDDTCERSDHICVRHPRCSSSTPLCYPLSMIDHRLCPPSASLSIPSTTTAGTVPMTTWTVTGSPSWNATGFPSWNATASPSWNATGSTPTWNATGFPSWNATDSTPTWNATVPISTTSFAPVSVYSYYTNTLSVYSTVIPGTVNKYYQTINIIVQTSGLYNFTSTSYMDTFAALYKDGFSPSDFSQYLVSSINTFDVYRQFKLSHNLIAGAPYTLVLTTTSYGQTGVFTLIASGPDSLRLF